ncbi:MAG: hypothetical protein ABIR26_17155 [Ramlibacter sp.]
MPATQHQQEAGEAADRAADQPRPIPDEDGPHDVPDEKVIEKTLPTGPVGDGKTP